MLDRIMQDVRVELLEEYDLNFERKAFFSRKWTRAKADPGRLRGIPNITYRNAKYPVQRAQVTVNLHIVTRMSGLTFGGSFGQKEALAYFDLIDTVHQAVHGLSGEHFSPLVRTQSHTNHDHDEIVENIEVYECIIGKPYLCLVICTGWG